MLTAVNKTCSPLAACPTAGCYDSTPAAQDNVCRHNAMLQSMRNFTFFSAEIMLLHPSACSPGMTLAVNDNLCGHETVCVTNSWNTFAWQWKPCHEPRDTLHHNINTVMSWGSSQTVHVQVVTLLKLNILSIIRWRVCFEGLIVEGVLLLLKCVTPSPLSGYKCDHCVPWYSDDPVSAPVSGIQAGCLWFTRRCHSAFILIINN